MHLIHNSYFTLKVDLFKNSLYVHPRFPKHTMMLNIPIYYNQMHTVHKTLWMGHYIKLAFLICIQEPHGKRAVYSGAADTDREL